MDFEAEERHKTVRDGYQLLLRAHAELILPTAFPEIREFYNRLCDICMTWATEVHGEMLKSDFAKLEGIHEKSCFRAQSYRFQMRIPWSDENYAAFVCESILKGQWSDIPNSYHRISHVWNLREQSVLPFSQILKVFGIRLTKPMFPFRPDGIYPDGDGMILFRNATRTAPFAEKRFARLHFSTDGNPVNGNS